MLCTACASYCCYSVPLTSFIFLAHSGEGYRNSLYLSVCQSDYLSVSQSILVCTISPESFERVSLYVGQMLILLTQCAEPMDQVRRLKVKITVQGHWVDP